MTFLVVVTGKKSEWLSFWWSRNLKERLGYVIISWAKKAKVSVLHIERVPLMRLSSIVWVILNVRKNF